MSAPAWLAGELLRFAWRLAERLAPVPLVVRLIRRFLALIRRAPVVIRPPSAWLAGSTRRWHTNPVFASTDDRVDAHSARVAILILQFRPLAPAALLRAAIVHDLGENSVGDLALPVKRENPGLYAALEGLEGEALHAMGFDIPAHVLGAPERDLLHLCDGLDAYLWAAFHRPDFVRARDDWRAMFAGLQSRADALGVRPKFNEIVEGVCNGKF
jgi:hypothetical protein